MTTASKIFIDNSGLPEHVKDWTTKQLVDGISTLSYLLADCSDAELKENKTNRRLLGLRINHLNSEIRKRIL